MSLPNAFVRASFRRTRALKRQQHDGLRLDKRHRIDVDIANSNTPVQTGLGNALPGAVSRGRGEPSDKLPFLHPVSDGQGRNHGFET